MKKNKQLLAEIFTIAKEYLKTPGDYEFDHTQYICFAILYAKEDGLLTQEQFEIGQYYIRKRLGVHESIEAWVYKSVPSATNELSNMCYLDRQKQSQAYRHRWLDHLIAKFSK